MPKQRKARQLPLEDHATKSTRKKLAPMRIAKIVTGLRSISRDGQNDPFQPVSTSTMMALISPKKRNSLHGV